MPERLTSSIAESVLTLVVMDDREGTIAAGLLDPDLMEEPYNDIAARAIEFRRKFGKAPGAAHIDDLFDHVLADPKNKKQYLYQQVLGAVLEQAKGLNPVYTLSRLNDFTRRQQLKAAVIKASETLLRGGDDMVADVETTLHEALKSRSRELDIGTFLNDRKRALSFLTAAPLGYSLGIPELDRRGIGPAQGEALVFMAPKGRGKTWFCIHAAVMALLQKAYVVHVSLEMSEKKLMGRYMQRLFAIAKREGKTERTGFTRDELERLTAFPREKTTPKLNFQDPRIAEKLRRKMGEWGERFGHLVVKQFPTSALTITELEAYLDALELTCKFVPTVLIVDYPKLMSLDRRQDLRIGLGLMLEQLRGLCIKRNVAGVFPWQSNREGEDAKLITGKHSGEDYSQGQTADIVLTYNQTAREHDLDLARIYVDKARDDEDRFAVLIAQHYATGQFCIDSAFMPNDFWSMIKEPGGDEE